MRKMNLMGIKQEHHTSLTSLQCLIIKSVKAIPGQKLLFRSEALGFHIY